MNTAPSPLSPYVGSERQFRRFEQYVADIVTQWPKAIVFTPQPPINSVETLSTRIRMCIKSLRDNQWKTNIPMTKFIQICDEIVVSTNANPGKVTCGPEDLIRKFTPLTTKAETAESQDRDDLRGRIILTNPSDEVIRAIIILHHAQVLNEPSEITTPLPLEAMTIGKDVGVTRQGDTYTIL